MEIFNFYELLKLEQKEAESRWDELKSTTDIFNK